MCNFSRLFFIASCRYVGRRNLTDFQRNEVALKYEKIISERMKERQTEYHGNQYQKVDFGSNDHKSKKETTTTRKELAKIAGTSDSSIKRKKYILENGTDEQIERARKGG